MGIPGFPILKLDDPMDVESLEAVRDEPGGLECIWNEKKRCFEVSKPKERVQI